MEKISLSISALDLPARSPAEPKPRRRARACIIALSIIILMLALAVPQNQSFGILSDVDFTAELSFELNDDIEGEVNRFATVFRASPAFASSHSDKSRFAPENHARLRMRHLYSPSDPRGPPASV